MDMVIIIQIVMFTLMVLIRHTIVVTTGVGTEAAVAVAVIWGQPK